MYPINWLAGQQWQRRGVAVMALFISSVATAVAQHGPATIRLAPDDATRGLNGPQHNFDFLAPGVDGDNYQTAGFFGQKLRPYLANNAEAVAYLDAYRRQKTLFLIDRLVAVGSFGLYGQQILAHGDQRQYFNGTQQVALGIFATSVLATIFINRNTNSHLLHAVEAYNVGPTHTSRWPRLRPTSVGVALVPTGQPLLAVHWTLR